MSKTSTNKKAVVLLSGGIDSSTVLYYAKSKNYLCRCLIFDYGQKHVREISSAKNIAKSAKIPFRVLTINLPWKSSSLIDKSKKIPVHKDLSKLNKLPSTYVPGRNTIFLSYALSYAEELKASTIFIGANILDYSGYPDCRPNYYKLWNKLLKSLGLNIKILAPLQYLNKSQILKLGTRLNVPYKYTWSCYSGKAKPCGICDSCKFRSKGFSKIKLQDPLA
ncbi:7-cyano-7-deazaguanine synthase QueC [Elusimicrobiota bacterium]